MTNNADLALTIKKATIQMIDGRPETTGWSRVPVKMIRKGGGSKTHASAGSRMTMCGTAHKYGSSSRGYAQSADDITCARCSKFLAKALARG